jgi:hypothetical protein
MMYVLYGYSYVQTESVCVQTERGFPWLVFVQVKTSVNVSMREIYNVYVNLCMYVYTYIKHKHEFSLPEVAYMRMCLFVLVCAYIVYTHEYTQRCHIRKPTHTHTHTHTHSLSRSLSHIQNTHSAARAHTHTHTRLSHTCIGSRIWAA